MKVLEGPKVVKTTHKAPYAAISPSRPELSQKGRVVYVTGGSAGIGFAICRAFAQADAATVILTGRRQGALNEAVDVLSKEYPNTKFIGQALDVTDRPATEKTWVQMESDGIVVDVLVLNVAYVPTKLATMLEMNYEELWPSWATNVGANIDLVDRFYHQKKRVPGRKLSLINVSSAAIHDFESAKMVPNYSASKNAGTLMVQLVARGVSPDDMQVLSFHPGVIFTDAAQKTSASKDAWDWDDVNLAGHYAVWAASEEAKFLHGRFTWSAWDVNELQTGEPKKKIDENPTYLQVGVVGLS
ncbi:short chain dehydrogenase [Trichoderma arundinaceum]|uniref:Short chain dehydrogenase n=1 Tax=Trichoderma arundinaceum TaxID=490622 RepID=A0A395N9V7_TRIAR|nr:short chain dehydrogenase [Trichoderma arundinaceum]